MTTTELPLVVVLGEEEPPLLDRVKDRARLRQAGEADLADALREADALLVWDFLTDALPAAWPERGGPRWVHTASAGVDRLLFPALLRSGAVITNSRGVFEEPIAEYVAGLVLALAKDLPGTLGRQRSRTWEHRETESVAGTRAVVVGGGPIGRAVARVLRLLGLRVALVSRTARERDPEFGRVHGFGELPGLLPDADWVVGAAPLTGETEDMFDAAAFARMKPGARFVNVGRGPLVVEDDLVAALREGRLGAAALDVFRREPLPADSPLWTVPGLIVSPHMSADTHGRLEDLAELFLANFARWAAGRPLRNVVDNTLGYVPVGEAPGDTPHTEEGSP
jgi:phosphoglycerate dehydrogenase-like enzyme